MTKEEATQFLKCSGMDDEQIEAVVKAIEGPPVVTYPSVKITGNGIKVANPRRCSPLKHSWQF